MTINDSRNNNNVLVVDDFAAVRNYLVTLLSGAGFDTVGVPDASTALAMLQADDFDLLVTDVRMPGMSGFELVRATRTIRPDIRIVLMTGGADVSVSEWADACGYPANERFPVDGMWLKPLDPRSIVDSVRDLVTN